MRGCKSEPVQYEFMWNGLATHKETDRSAGQDVKSWSPMHCWGDVKWVSQSRKKPGRSSKGYTEFPYGLATALLGTPKRNENVSPHKHTRVLMAALSLRAKKLRQPKCQSRDEWTPKKAVHPYQSIMWPGQGWSAGARYHMTPLRLRERSRAQTTPQDDPTVCDSSHVRCPALLRDTGLLY